MINNDNNSQYKESVLLTISLVCFAKGNRSLVTMTSEERYTLFSKEK